MAKITWSVQSLEDIENIAEYIANDSLKYAEIQVATFFDSANILEEYPQTGRIVPEFGKANIRELIIGFYRLIYRITSQDHIDILTVYHSRRLLKRKTIKK